MNEFDVIAKYFLPLTQGRAEAGSLRDDAAVLDVPEGCELVVTSDTLNAGTHFPVEAAPDDIAHKALRVNLSDLAAMGARPYAYQLNIAFPERPREDWLAAFTAALLKDQAEFGIFCSGGDTTSIKGPLSISVTAMGLADRGKVWKRSGAESGDVLVLTGPPGDAWIGLQILQGKMRTEDDEYFTRRYYRPSPRFVAGPVHGAIDISDGLVADLRHICHASGLAAHIAFEKILFSPQAEKLLAAGQVTPEQLLTGGDDYELLLACAPEYAGDLPGHVIGRFETGAPDVCITKAGVKLDFQSSGWTHF